MKILFFVAILVNFFFASWYVTHGDIIFNSDTARDFFLYREITEKKIVLLGPRASGGLYHGPVWAYLNYPAYWLGYGNPVVVGWFWLLLIVGFLVISYILVKNLFGKTIALLYVLFESGYLAFHARQMSHPHGAMFTLPVFFYFFVRYWETGKMRYFLLHLFTAIILVQFELAVGMPFLILSFIAITYRSFRTKKFTPLLYYSLLAIGFANFIFFDFRHNHILFKLVTNFVSPQHFNYSLFLNDRIKLAFSAMEILRRDSGYRNLGLFLFMLTLIAIQIKDKKHVSFYLSFLYFYLGYFILSFIDKGPILYFYLFPMFPFVHLIFTSLYTSRYRWMFLIVFGAVATYNLLALIGDTQDANAFIGKDVTSWKFLSSVAQKAFAGPEQELGYFVFTPDTVGYSPKYAMFYNGSITQKNIFPFQKKRITYLIAEPHQYFSSDWWKENKAHIAATPVETFTFPNGYKIEKYELDAKQIAVPAEPDIDPGLFFR